MTNKWTWKDAPDLMAELTRVQNAPVNSNIDIMSYAGMCDTRAELELHLARCEIRTQNAEQDAEYAAAR